MNCEHKSGERCLLADAIDHRANPCSIGAERVCRRSPDDRKKVVADLAVSGVANHDPVAAAAILNRFLHVMPITETRCVHRGEELQRIDGDLLDCNCPSASVWKCGIRGECVLSPLNPDAGDVLKTIRPEWDGAACVTCPQRAIEPSQDVSTAGPVSPASAFGRVVVISLSGRGPVFPSDWPFAAPEISRSVDGRRVPIPDWWTAGRGAWGCFRGHVRAIEQALNDGVESLLLLEEDAVFAPDFVPRVRQFLSAVPDDWQCLYLGGQLLKQRDKPPVKVAEGVYSASNVNRTHAWALRGEGLRIAYRHLHDWESWIQEQHIDHALGRLHESGRMTIYVPDRWLVGQGEGRSTVAETDVDERWWQDPCDVAAAAGKDGRPLIAVVGPFRSGTSCVAGMLHAMGVSMGRSWRTIPGNPKGTFEAPRLLRICHESYREPQMTRLPEADRATERLRRWLRNREESPSGVLGAKHPTLCMLVPELLAAWPATKVVAVNRPAIEAAASLAARAWPGWRETEIAATLTAMRAARDQAIARFGVATTAVDYAQVVHDPRGTVETLTRFCGLQPTQAEREASVAFVDKGLRHHA